MVKKPSFLVSVRALVILQNELTAPSIGLSIVAILKESKKELVFYKFHPFSGKIPPDKSTESVRYIAF